MKLPVDEGFDAIGIDCAGAPVKIRRKFEVPCQKIARHDKTITMSSSDLAERRIKLRVYHVFGEDQKEH